MMEHVSAWLEAYHDGELSKRRSRQVEAYVADCASCRAELEALRALTGLLQESPAPLGLMSPERFVAQVGLRLPRRPVQPAWRRALEAGWRLAPAGLLGTWAFVQALIIVSGIVLTGIDVGLAGDVAAALLPAQQPNWGLIEIIRLAGVDLSDASRFMLDILGTGTGLSLTTFASVINSVVFGLLLWSWLASWWARHQHRPGAVGAQLAIVESH